MTRPPFPLVSSGRRAGAGPGRQFGGPSFSTWPATRLIVVALAATLILSPAVVAVLSMIDAGRLDLPGVHPIVTFPLMPILEGGRLLATVGLATMVMRTRELE